MTSGENFLDKTQEMLYNISIEGGKIFMKLKEFFTYLKPDEVISIVDEYGTIVEPVEYQKMPYIEVSESLDAVVVQVYYDSGDSSLTIDVAFDDEEED